VKADITERLRKRRELASTGQIGTVDVVSDEDCIEAADVIERLREENLVIKGVCRNYCIEVERLRVRVAELE